MGSKKSKTISGADRERKNRSYKTSTPKIENKTFTSEDSNNWSPLTNSSAEKNNSINCDAMVSGADRERRNRSYISSSKSTTRNTHYENKAPIDPYVGYEISSDLSSSPSKYEIKSEKADTPTGMISGADRERKNRSYK